jgi:hypothetical protein
MLFLYPDLCLRPSKSISNYGVSPLNLSKNLRRKHKVLTYVEYRAVFVSSKILPPQPPLHPASVSPPPHQRRGVHTRRAVRGQYFWKTHGMGLASYTIISLRSEEHRDNLINLDLCLYNPTLDTVPFLRRYLI